MSELTKEIYTKGFNPIEIRKQFPGLNVLAHGKPLVYFDNAATAMKPNSVIEAEMDFYRKYNSNVHRGIHFLSDLATRAYEHTRETAKNFLHAKHLHEIIFTRGTTDGINLVASSFAKKYFKEGSEIILSGMEHHSNIVPWQLAAETFGAKIKVIPVNDRGELIVEELQKLISPSTAIIALSHVSNTLGTINPVKEIIAIAHKHSIPVLLDGAQATPHQKVDVKDLDCDFYVFSGHKNFGPTGTGILYGKEKWLEEMPPYQGGGNMISKVTFEKTTWNELPHKFEAGTPNMAGMIALSSALDFVNEVGFSTIHQQEELLLHSAESSLEKIDGLRIIGTSSNKASVISFVVDGVHPSDLGTLLDQEGIAIRTGHHCTQPLLERFGLTSTARASFSFYNTSEEVEIFINALNKSLSMLR